MQPTGLPVTSAACAPAAPGLTPAADARFVRWSTRSQGVTGEAGHLKYTRVYSDAEGESHFEDVEVGMNEVVFAPPAPPLKLSEFMATSRFSFLSADPGWSGDWHPAPKRQFMLYLQGEIEAEVSDGEVRRFGPGSATLVEDTKGRGHRSAVVGDQEVVMAVVQLDD